MDDRKPTEPIASLLLSGTEIKVGVEHSAKDSSVWFQTHENPEPAYVSVTEAKLLITALEAAVAEATSPS